MRLDGHRDEQQIRMCYAKEKRMARTSVEKAPLRDVKRVIRLMGKRTIVTGCGGVVADM